ncbi:hypothetical protein GC177_05800 [bacterium]|nr:hypothetical protein [bacterium]
MTANPFNDERALNLAFQEQWREEKEDNTEKRTLEDTFKDAALMFSALIEHAKAGLLKAKDAVKQPFSVVADAYFTTVAIMDQIKTHGLVSTVESIVSQLSSQEAGRATAYARAVK